MRRERGFTLVESLVSTLVFGLIVGIVFGFLAPANKASNKVRLEAEMGNQGEMALSRLTRDTQSATSVANSATDTSLVLNLQRYASNGNLLDGQFDQVTYRKVGSSLTYSRSPITDQVVLRNLQDDVTLFSYFDASLADASGSLSNARVIRIALHTARSYGGRLLQARQTRDVRLRNAP
ncbi:MAG TPA: hypothetical protein DD435_08565 [Cyanobacteria bacterium UBA8530]|nr:hypothetical protein [Cyanobacteria bacterium UBA8530]